MLSKYVSSVVDGAACRCFGVTTSVVMKTGSSKSMSLLLSAAVVVVAVNVTTVIGGWGRLAGDVTSVAGCCWL